MPTAQPVIRDREFAKRLEVAVENHHLAPSGHGRQKWLRDRIHENFSVTLSPEAVRKWFAGEARPRPQVMHQVARVLEVDEAWLSLGITPTATPREKQKQNALTNGAVNLVAAQIQLAGGNIAFPEEEEPDHDLFAIVKGKQHAVSVKLGTSGSKFKISVLSKAKTIVAVVPTERPTVYEFLNVPAELVAEHGTQRGGFRECEIEKARGGGYKIGGKRLAYINSFAEI